MLASLTIATSKMAELSVVVVFVRACHAHVHLSLAMPSGIDTEFYSIIYLDVDILYIPHNHFTLL